MNLIGIDLGTHKVTVAVFLDSKLVMVHTYEAAEGDRARALCALGEYVAGLAALHSISDFWVEEVIIGNNRKYSLQLAETKGAVLGALGHMPVEVRTVDNQTWKKAIVGTGHASKDDVRNYIAVSTPYAPLCGDDQDAYDATCIGLYGIDLNQRAEHLELSDPANFIG